MESHFGYLVYSPTLMTGSVQVEDQFAGFAYTSRAQKLSKIMGAILFKTGFKCDRITQRLYLSGRTFAPGKLHRSSRIILLQQRLPTPSQLQAVAGGVGVAVAYQDKPELICVELTCKVPVELCPSVCKVILVIDMFFV